VQKIFKYLIVLFLLSSCALFKPHGEIGDCEKLLDESEIVIRELVAQRDSLLEVINELRR